MDILLISGIMLWITLVIVLIVFYVRKERFVYPIKVYAANLSDPNNPCPTKLSDMRLLTSTVNDGELILDYYSLEAAISSWNCTTASGFYIEYPGDTSFTAKVTVINCPDGTLWYYNSCGPGTPPWGVVAVSGGTATFTPIALNNCYVNLKLIICPTPSVTGNYTQSCQYCNISGNTFTCQQCTNGLGNTVYSSIQLSDTSTNLSNINGVLTQTNPLPPGPYNESCMACSVNGSTLSCSCLTGQYSAPGSSYTMPLYNTTSIQINPNASYTNTNGYLNEQS